MTEPSGVGLSSTDLNFGAVDITVDGATTATVTVTNTGTGDLVLSAFFSAPIPALGRFGQLLLMLMIGLIGMQLARHTGTSRLFAQ